MILYPQYSEHNGPHEDHRAQGLPFLSARWWNQLLRFGFELMKEVKDESKRLSCRRNAFLRSMIYKAGCLAFVLRLSGWIVAATNSTELVLQPCLIHGSIIFRDSLLDTGIPHRTFQLRPDAPTVFSVLIVLSVPVRP